MTRSRSGSAAGSTTGMSPEDAPNSKSFLLPPHVRSIDSTESKHVRACRPRCSEGACTVRCGFVSPWGVGSSALKSRLSLLSVEQAAVIIRKK